MCRIENDARSPVLAILFRILHRGLHTGRDSGRLNGLMGLLDERLVVEVDR